MGIRREFPVADRKFFRELLGKLGYDQKDLVNVLEPDQNNSLGSQEKSTKKGKITKSWLSNALQEKEVNEKGKVNKVDSEKLSIVAGILAGYVKVSSLPDDEIQIALENLKIYRPSIELPSTKTRPGGIIRPGATYYVKRAAEEEILKVLQGMAQTSLITGPPQVGVSSLLSILTRRATELGIATVHYDPITAAGIDRQQLRGQSRSERLLVFVESLYSAIQEEWGLPAEDKQVTSTIDLVRWIQRALNPTAGIPRLLVLDNLHFFGSDVIEDINSFLVRSITNKRATNGAQIRLVVGLAYSYGYSFERSLLDLSSMVAWQPRIDLSWMTYNEVKQMQEQAGGVVDPKDLYALLRGQPFLTHAFLHDTDFNQSLSVWIKDKSEGNSQNLRDTKPYQSHLEAIKASILGVGDVEIIQENIIQTFQNISEGQSYIGDRDEEVFLEKNSMVSDGHMKIEIYALMAKDLLLCLDK
jgi:hypothetical protein